MLVSIKNITVNRENRMFQGSPKVLESVKREGIIVPLIVYEESKGKYHLVDGHNRLHSAKHYGLERVPVTVISKESAATFGEVANIDRQPLSEMDEIISINKLAENGYSTREIAGLLGISRAKAGRKVNVLKSLCTEAKDKLQAKRLSLKEAELLTLVDKEKQLELMKAPIHEYAVHSLIGIDMKDIGECFKDGCRLCKHNTSSDADLFDEETTICRNPECLKKKISDYARENGYEGVTGWVSSMSILSDIDNYVKMDYSTASTGSPKKDYANQKKFIDLKGNDVYMGGEKLEGFSISPAERKRAAIIEVVDELNEKLLDIYSAIRNKAFDVALSHADKSDGNSSFFETEAIYYAAKFLLSRTILPIERRYIEKNAGGADYSKAYDYKAYFSIKYPSLAKIDDVKTKPEFKKAVRDLIIDNAAIELILSVQKKIKDFPGFQVFTEQWLIASYLDGSFIEKIRQLAKLFESKFGSCVPDGDMTKASLLYAEACRLNGLPITEFEEV